MEQIVRKLDDQPAPAAQPGTSPDGERREIVVNVQAESMDRLLKRAVVKTGRGSAFEIHCDEGAALGGDDSAPPPLAYFSAGIAF